MIGSWGLPVPRLRPKRSSSEPKRSSSESRAFCVITYKLELSDAVDDHDFSRLPTDAKTLITHAADKSARVLGYEISSMHADDKRDRRGRRSVNGHIKHK